MTNFTKSTGGSALQAVPASHLDSRMRRTMAAVVLLAVAISAVFAPWRITTGLLLGGSLSLLNHHWIQSSIGAAFKTASLGKRPKIHLAKFVLRYLVVGICVYAAYRLEIASLPATIVGLTSFVAALFVEALREFYFTIVHREEID